jgi:PAS domain S-box-containing protein
VRLDIENKILIPFTILLLLSITVLGTVSYHNSYQLLLDNQKKNVEETLTEAVHFLDNINREMERGAIPPREAKSTAIEYYKMLNKSQLVIIQDSRVILGSIFGKEFLPRTFSESLSQNSNGMITEEDVIFIYKHYPPWNWILGYRLNKSVFMEEFLEMQKYTILALIIFLVISMQATIFISHNISRPVQQLADLCNKIARGSLQERIKIRRKDEIGVLADAFNNMMHKLRMNTNQLLEMKQFNEDILRNISTGIITTDKEGNLVSMNQSAREILDQNSEYAKYEGIKGTLFTQVMDTLKSKKNINHIRVFHNDNEGGKLYFDVTTTLMKTHDGFIGGAICSFNDITERKKIESNMERVDRLTSIGQLASGIAHEIRNPLAGMKTSIQVLKKRLSGREADSNLVLFNGVLFEIDRINNLITDLLDFAKPRLPKYEVENTLEILNKSLYLVKKDASEKNISVKVTSNASKMMLFVDKAQIEQVFLNVIKNAINAMDSGGILNISLNQVHNKKRDCLEIVFHDNGCGVPEENIDRIFDPFFTTYPHGTGLGLSVVYELVSKNNGEVEIESVINAGTKVRITFPLYGGEICNEQGIGN